MIPNILEINKIIDYLLGFAKDKNIAPNLIPWDIDHHQITYKYHLDNKFSYLFIFTFKGLVVHTLSTDTGEISDPTKIFIYKDDRVLNLLLTMERQYLIESHWNRLEMFKNKVILSLL